MDVPSLTVNCSFDFSMDKLSKPAQKEIATGFKFFFFAIGVGFAVFLVRRP